MAHPSFSGHRIYSKPDGSTPESWETYACGHCGVETSGAVIAYHQFNTTPEEDVATPGHIYWLWCTNCAEPTALSSDGRHFPGLLFGPTIEGLPDRVKDAYTEARRCISVNAWTSCELICRSIICYTSIDLNEEVLEKRGGRPNFTDHIDNIVDAGFINLPMTQWIDKIRERGNETTHTLEAPSPERAKDTLTFTAMLLRLVYEMQYLATKHGEGAEKSGDKAGE